MTKEYEQIIKKYTEDETYESWVVQLRGTKKQRGRVRRKIMESIKGSKINSWRLFKLENPINQK
jgi:hypothetical protein